MPTELPADDLLRFTVFVAVSLLVFVALLRFVTRRRVASPHGRRLVGVALVVVVAGMMFAKFGHNLGLPWWIYYTVPALVTLLLPPIAFRFNGPELAQYLVLAFLASPAIHVVFSLLLDWHEYMPFLHVPSLRSLMRGGG